MIVLGKKQFRWELQNLLRKDHFSNTHAIFKCFYMYFLILFLDKNIKSQSLNSSKNFDFGYIKGKKKIRIT